MEKYEKYKVIVIAGTPGVGKTTISKILVDKLGVIHIDLSELAISKRLYSFYDEKRESYVIDEYRLVSELKRILKQNNIFIIDTHYPEILPKEIVDIVIVLRLHPRILEKRLQAKNWSWRKIRENLLAEILSVVTVNAIEKFGINKVYEINTTDKTLEQVIENIIDILEEPGKHKPGLVIDWLTILPPEEILKYEYEEVSED